jgi:acetyl-CoA carboxylase carboxyl transferase subunit beta
VSSSDGRWPWLEGFEALEGGARSEDPLAFPGYREQLERARERAGTDESVTCGMARVAGHPVVAVVFTFAFLGGSMGEATGRRIVQAVDLAAERRVPLVSLPASGGARMQEGMRSLVQMQAVAAALVRLRQAGVPHIAVARAPTTGGVWASFVSVADVVLAERGGTVAFAGARVRGDEGDTGAFLAEGKLESGAVDGLYSEDELPALVGRHVRVLAAALATEPAVCLPPRALPGALASAVGWDAVTLARGGARPRAAAYLAEHFDETIELSGDRAGGCDPHLRCGIGLRGGTAIAFVAQTGEANTPAGFRTAVRVLELAGRLQIPVLTLIDTPGATNDARAEDQGIGTSIAQAFAAVAASPVPITSLLVGEGGSGGALALAAPGNLWAVPSSYFSVIAPEGAAAILHRDPSRAAEVADALRLDPSALVELGIVNGIVDGEVTGVRTAALA